MSNLKIKYIIKTTEESLNEKEKTTELSSLNSDDIHLELKDFVRTLVIEDKQFIQITITKHIEKVTKQK